MARKVEMDLWHLGLIAGGITLIAYSTGYISKKVPKATTIKVHGAEFTGCTKLVIVDQGKWNAHVLRLAKDSGLEFNKESAIALLVYIFGKTFPHCEWPPPAGFTMKSSVGQKNTWKEMTDTFPAFLDLISKLQGIDPEALPEHNE